MQLKNMKIGEKARIISLLSGEKVYRHKLIAMGLLPGTELIVTRIAPLGDPIEMTVRGFTLSLRKHEATILQLEEVKP
jgi:ferrous iron transport protein A